MTPQNALLLTLGCIAVAALAAYCAPTHAAQCGIASWYGAEHHGNRTASGEPFNMHSMTAAHKSLPFGTSVRVEDQRTGRSVRVRINDRGPFVGGRIIDLSREAATALGVRNAGTARVCIE